MAEKKKVMVIMPRAQRDFKRIIEISDAICNYADARKKVPIVWYEEFYELIHKYFKY